MSIRPQRPPALRYRPARRTDVETLAELGQLAYRVSSLEQRREFYTDHPRFSLRDVRVGELDGRIVASLVLYPLFVWVRGQRVPLAGVGSVAVSPEHRRRGVAEALMRAALRELRQQGRAFSVLYAFRGSYYRRLGYGVIEVVHQLAVSPSNLPASDETRRVRRLLLPDRHAVEAIYERVAQQGHFALERSPQWWSRRLWDYPGDWVVYEGRRRGQIEGYLHYEVDTTHGPFRLGLTLSEFVAATPEAHRGLVGYLGSLADQVQEIHHSAPGDNAWLATLLTAQNLRPGPEIGMMLDSGGVAHGAMLRVTDVKTALESFPIAPHARGEVVLEVDDPVLPLNARAWRVSVRDGRLRVRPDIGRAPVRRAAPAAAAPAGAQEADAGRARGGARVPRLRVPADVLGPLIAGTLSPTGAAAAGLVASDGGAEVVEPWFRARAAYLYPMNVF
ncbi:MAG TPA: GNAT family N-acetyltransferase [Terriglobales bacterium]|nr:GNAT family N-acetyltransferase [Terriglobales bacterium]